jgi:uncharacterized repeat protein (TIGR01451 family)
VLGESLSLARSRLVKFISAQVLLLCLFMGAGLSLAGINPLHAIQSENYPAGGQVEIINDFIRPNPVNPNPQQGGDGLRAIPTPDKVYAIYHHSYNYNGSNAFSRVDISCANKATGSTCAGFPKAITLNGAQAITEQASSFGVIDYKKQKVYFGAANSSSSGIACFDLNTGTECGYTVTDNAPPLTSIDSTRYPNIQTLPYDNENDFDNFDGTIYYMYESGGVSRIGCKVIDSSYGGSCNASSVTYDTSNMYKLVSSYGDKAYFITTNSSNVDVRVGCYDKSTGNDCGSGTNGWDTGGDLPLFVNTVPIIFPDLNKACVGLTGTNYSGSNKFSCVDLTSGASTINSSGNASLDNILNNIFKTQDHTNVWFPSYIKGKLYLSNSIDVATQSASDKDMYCWDIATSNECSEFSGGVDWSPTMTTPKETRDYAYIGDRYTDYRCAWALGDKGFLIPFRLDGSASGTSCLNTSIGINVDLSEYLCKPELGLIESISIENINMADVDYADARFTDQNGNPLSVDGASTLDLKALGGQKIYSPQIAGLTYISVNGSLVLNTLSNWNSASPPVLKLVINPNGSNLIKDGCTTAACLELGNRIFIDVDHSGIFSVGDVGLDNVDLELVSVGADNVIGGTDDVVVDTTTTSGGGYYNFDCFNPGRYYVRVASSEQASGGTIEGLVPASSSADLNNDVDDDNNLINSGGTYRTDALDLNFGTEPAGEYNNNPSPTALDTDSNLTIDLALEHPYDVELNKSVDGNSDSNYTKLEQIPTPGDSGNPDPTVFTYKLEVSAPASADTSTGIVLTDIVKPGIKIISVNPSQGSVPSALPLTGAASTGTPLLWNVGTLTPGSSATLILNAELSSSDLGSFSTGFADGVSRNVAQITSMDQLDIDSTPNNITTYNPTSHEDDESDASVTIPPIIGDRVWKDTDNNGIQDSGEEGVSGVTIKLYKDIDGIPGPSAGDTLEGSQITNTDGNWMFGGLDPGAEYYVSLDPSTIPSGWIASTPFQGGTISADSNSSSELFSDNHLVASGEVNLDVDFGLHPRNTLGNYIFYDINNNGHKDSGEPGIPGVTVQLFAAADTGFTTPLQTVISDGSGRYSFMNIDAGDYLVRIPNINNDTGQSYFSSSASGYEPAADPDNNTDDDDNGNQSGVTVVSDVISLGYNDEPITDGDTDSYTNLTLDFGFTQIFSVGNRVFLDDNGDGYMNSGEFGLIDAVSLKVLNSDQTPYDSDLSMPGIQEMTTTTDAEGFYHFDGLPAGDYRIEATLPAGYRSTADNADTNAPNSNTNSSDRGLGTSGGTVTTGVFTLGVSGAEPTGEEDSQTASTNPALPDVNRNMTIDLGVVSPFDLRSTKSIVSGSQTYATGLINYDILVENIGSGPAKGDIQVIDRLPTGMTYDSVSSLGSNWSCVDASGEITCTRSAASGALIGGASDELTISARINSGENSTAEYVNSVKVQHSLTEYNDETIPLGIDDSGYETGDNTVDSNNDSSAGFNVLRYSIGNQLFIDLNNSTAYDSGDLPLANIDIELVSPGPDGDYATTGDNITYNTVTNSSGEYQFTGLPFSNYRVNVNNLPTGLTNIYDVDGNHNSSSDVIFIDPMVTSDQTHDFGYLGNASLGDYVWWDINGDGIQDSNEIPLSNVSIRLTWAGPDGDISTAGDNIQLTTTTDDNGKYIFDNLPAGIYSVNVTNPSSSMSLTTANQDHISVLNYGDSQLNSDFGFDDEGTIGDTVFLDLNNNGYRDAGDPGIAGVKLELYIDVDGDGKITNTDKLIKTDVTDSNGNYLFANLLLDDGITSNDSSMPNSASYIVRVVGIDESSQYAQYWDSLRHVLGTVGQNNNGQDIYGFSATISDSIRSVSAADFAYYNKDVVAKLYPNTIARSVNLSNTGMSAVYIIAVATVSIGISVAVKSKSSKNLKG